MAFIKSVLTFVAVFTLLGVTIGALTAPAMVRGELCGFSASANNISVCGDTVDKAARTVIRYQLTGAGTGAVVGLALGIVWNIRRRNKATSTPASPPASPA